MSEINEKQFWLQASQEIDADIELLNGLIALPELDDKMLVEATNEARKTEKKIRDMV